MPTTFIELFRSQADAHGRMSFADFMRLALYDSQLGYYTRDRVRVGRATNTDFFTATQSPLFGELVAAACTTLVAPRAPSEFTFVEIGAEPSGGIFTGQAHPFAEIGRASCRERV